MIDTGVILAAGLGSRLKELNEGKPKGFLKIDQTYLIDRSISLLRRAGASRIIIGTGYRSDLYESHFASDKSVQCIQNDRYNDSGSMYTLYKLRSAIKGDFILAESDLIYEYRALDVLLSAPSTDTILASGKTNSGDEVYIETNSDGTLVNMSKTPEKLSRIDGELVGLTKLSLSYAELLWTTSAKHFNSKNLHLDYEDALVSMTFQRPITICKVEDLLWCEIDNEEQLLRARSDVWPNILKKERLNA